MRYCRFQSEDDGYQKPLAIDRMIYDIKDLAAVMKKADYHDWLQGLGQPMCNSDLKCWHAIGEFLENYATKSS